MSDGNECQHQYLVYGHWLDGDLFYVGKGNAERALYLGINRCLEWCLARAKSSRPVEVRIIAGFNDDELACLRYERLLMNANQPRGNSRIELAGGPVLALEKGLDHLFIDRCELYMI